MPVSSDSCPPPSDSSLRAPNDLDTSQLKMKAGGLMPVGSVAPRGLGILRAILTRKMVVKGLLTRTITALQFIALVSVVS